MKPTDTTPNGQTAFLSMEFDLRHSPERVWHALTDPQLLAAWLLPMVGPELTTGAQFVFQTDPQPGWDGVVNCRVLERDELRLLRLTWVVGAMDTVVTFTLTPTASGTLLSLVHEGFTAAQKQNFGGARYGWNLMGGRLFDLLGRLP